MVSSSFLPVKSIHYEVTILRNSSGTLIKQSQFVCPEHQGFPAEIEPARAREPLPARPKIYAPLGAERRQ